MQNVELDAEFRSSNGKGFARRLRMAGQIPAVLYSRGNATSISLNLALVQKAFHSHAGSHAIFRLKVTGASDGEGSVMALIRDVQRDRNIGITRKNFNRTQVYIPPKLQITRIRSGMVF